MKPRFILITISIAVFALPLFAQVADGNTNVESDPSTSDSTSVNEYVADDKPCRWWRRHCHPQIEGLPPGTLTTGVVITVDTTHNVAYLWRDGELIVKGPAATGSDKLLRHGLKQWLFRTPRGRHKILKKLVDPVWNKPDWAFVEEGKPIPPPDSPLRKVKRKLGKYALHLGDGILIHGTTDLDSLGKKASHGCIRLGPEMLELVYKHAEVDTEVHIF